MKEKRKEEMIEYVRLKNIVSLEELHEQFNVSMITVRRDVNELEKEGYITKVHGGVSFHQSQVRSINQRQHELLSEKDALGKMAADLVQDGQVIIIDAGSTTHHIVKYLKNKKVTIITDAINVLESALPYSNIQVILTGGRLMRETNSLVGRQVAEAIKRLNAHWAFIGATGVSIEKGITNSSIEEADIKRCMVEVAVKKVLLVDHTKMDVISMMKFATLNEMDIVITDKPVSDVYREYFDQYGIELKTILYQ